MRLLFINYEFPPLGGGAGRATAQIARQMARMGHEVTVLTSRFSGLPARESKDGYIIHRIPTLRKYKEKCRVFEMVAFLLSSLLAVLRLGKRWKPDMSVSFFTIPSAPASLLLKKVFRIPYIVSLRGGDVPGFMGKDLQFYHFLTKGAIRYMWRQSQAVVANSEGLKSLAQETSQSIDIKMIPNGVDADFFQEQAVEGQEERLKLFRSLGHSRTVIENEESTPFNILTVGRLSSQKGLDILIDAIDMLRNQSS